MSSQAGVWCSWHSDRAAVAVCRGCGRAGCESCIRSGRCVGCAAEEARSDSYASGPSLAGEEMPDPSVLSTRVGSAVSARLGTAAVAAVLVVVAVLQELTGGDSGAVSRALIFTPNHFLWLADSGHEMRGVADGQIWRILTSGLLHFGFWPLVLNLAAFVVSGAFVERLLGWRQLVVVYLTATPAAALSSYVFGDAVLQWSGAAAPVVGVLGCALLLALLSEDRAPQELGLLAAGRQLRVVVLSGSHRNRWLILFLVVYAAAASFEWFGFAWAPLAGGLMAGVVFAAVHAFLAAPLARRVMVALWLVLAGGFVARTVVIRNSGLYSSPGAEEGSQGVTMPALWLDYGATLAVGALSLTTVAAILIRQPSRQQRERQMMAAESAVRAQMGLTGQCPKSILDEYTHQAAEYALLADERERSPQHRLLLYFVALAVAAFVVMALLATIGADYPDSIWFYLWFPAVGVCLPVLGIFAGQWARRSRQHDAYAEFNGPYPDQMMEHVATRQRQLGVLELVTTAGVLVLTIASVTEQEEPFAAAFGCLPLIAVIWFNTYLADKGQAIKAVFG